MKQLIWLLRIIAKFQFLNVLVTAPLSSLYFILFFLTDINCQSPNKQGYFSLGTSDSLISRERLRTGTTYLYLRMLVDETRLEIQHVAFVTQSGAKIGC